MDYSFLKYNLALVIGDIHFPFSELNALKTVHIHFHYQQVTLSEQSDLCC